MNSVRVPAEASVSSRLVTSGLSSAHGNRWVVYIYRRLNGGWNLSQVFEPVTDPESIGRITGLEVQGANLFIGTIPSARNSIYSDGRLHIFNATSSGDFVLSQSMSAPRQGIEYELHIYGFGDRIVATPSHVVLSTVEGLQYGGDELLSVFVFDRTPLGLVLSSETVFGGTHADIAIAGSTIVAGLPSYSFGPYPGKGDAYTITAGNAACSRASSIVVDGSSADWAGVPRQKVGGYFANSTDFISPSGDADLSAMFRVQWDANRLYVIVEVQDDLVRGTSTGVYNNDSVELYLDGGHQQSSSYDADDYQLTVDWRGVRGGFRGQLIAYDSAVTITPTGYNVEYSIPWSALGSGSVAAGRIIGLDVALNDNDTGNATRNHHIVWYGDGTGWNDASQFADYSLSAGICGGIAVTACARSATVTIDGNAGEWSNIAQHPIGATAAVAGRPASDNDSSGSFRFQWDQSNLYALIEVRDDINGSAASAVYLNDGVELYLDGLRERSHAYDSNDYQLTVDRLGRKGGTRGNALTYTSAVASRPDGFAVEYAVPWSALGLTPSSFRVLGFDVAINDSDNSAAQRESQIIWKGNGLGWYDTSTFDGLELGAATCP